jgi:glutathione S-transferase
LPRLTQSGNFALERMNRHLDGRGFFVGDGPTAADISLYAYTHIAEEGGFRLEPYPHVRRWLGAVASLPGHVAMTEEA